MKKIKRIVIILFAVTSVLLSFPSIVSASRPRLNKSAIHLTQGQEYKLKITGTTKKAKWHTSNKKVAIVTTNGKIIGKKTGLAYITAKINKKELKCKILVVPKNKIYSYERQETFIGKLTAVKWEHITLGTQTSYILKLNKSIKIQNFTGRINQVKEIQIIPNSLMPSHYLNKYVIIKGYAIPQENIWHRRLLCVLRPQIY